MAGYSGTPLPQKLGIKKGMRIIAIGVPENYRKLLGKLPDDVEFSNRPGVDAQFIHFFVRRRNDLEKQLPRLRGTLADSGALWISWPKKSAGVATDVSEDAVRAVALPLGLVDVKVCAVDEIWSGLKLMIRREQRKPRNEAKTI
jgi:hypothetical protein